MQGDEIERRRPERRPDHFAHETAMRRRELIGRALAQRLGDEVDVGIDVEPAFAVLRIERVVAALERRRVDPTEADHELAPGEVGVDRQQRVVEVEKTEIHVSPSSACICLSSGTVIARLVDRENLSSRSSCAIRWLRSRAKRVSR